MKLSRVVAIVLVILAPIIVVMGQNEKSNPQLGTWRMNDAKSSFSAGTDFNSAISKIEVVPGGVRHTLDTVYADGMSHHYEYTTAYDGKDRPVNGNSPYGDTTALTRID